MLELRRTSLFFDENVRQPTARLNEDVSKLWQNVEWKRPKLFLPAVMGPAIGSQGQGQSDKANLFHNAGEEAGSVEPDDIRQGAIGDCYFLSSLSVLAEQDDRIKFLFFKNDPATDRNTDAAVDRGLFAVRFCIQGHWTQVLLDDCFPCYPDEVEVQNGKPDEKHIGEPIFSHSKGARNVPGSGRAGRLGFLPALTDLPTLQSGSSGCSSSRRRGPRCSAPISTSSGAFRASASPTSPARPASSPRPTRPTPGLCGPPSTRPSPSKTCVALALRRPSPLRVCRPTASRWTQRAHGVVSRGWVVHSRQHVSCRHPSPQSLARPPVLQENAQGWFVVALMPEHSEEDVRARVCLYCSVSSSSALSLLYLHLSLFPLLLQKKVGLIEGHAYAVLDTVEIFGSEHCCNTHVYVSCLQAAWLVDLPPQSPCRFLIFCSSPDPAAQPVGICRGSCTLAVEVCQTFLCDLEEKRLCSPADSGSLPFLPVDGRLVRC